MVGGRSRLRRFVAGSTYPRTMPCDYCGQEFDPISTRWLCPHCHMKANCCDGAPQQVAKAT